jgi:hypothetical protein
MYGVYVSSLAPHVVWRSAAEARPPDRWEDAMSNTALLPFQPDAMSPAQLAAVSYLAR